MSEPRAETTGEWWMKIHSYIIFMVDICKLVSHCLIKKNIHHFLTIMAGGDTVFWLKCLCRKGYKYFFEKQLHPF
jgi:hypothetical protein